MRKRNETIMWLENTVGWFLLRWNIIGSYGFQYGQDRSPAKYRQMISCWMIGHFFRWHMCSAPDKEGKEFITYSCHCGRSFEKEYKKGSPQRIWMSELKWRKILHKYRK